MGFSGYTDREGNDECRDASLDKETTRMVERMVAQRIKAKHVNFWNLQLEMKRQDISELAGLMELEDVKNEVETL